LKEHIQKGNERLIVDDEVAEVDEERTPKLKVNIKFSVCS
jgi:hypothetical protein